MFGWAERWKSPVLKRSVTGGKRKRTVHALDLKKVYTQTYICLNITSLYYIGLYNTECRL